MVHIVFNNKTRVEVLSFFCYAVCFFFAALLCQCRKIKMWDSKMCRREFKMQNELRLGLGFGFGIVLVYNYTVHKS